MKVKVDKTLVASIALHVLVLGVGLVTFSSRSMEVSPPSPEVDTMSDTQFSQMMKGIKSGDKNKTAAKVDKVSDAPSDDEAVGKVTNKKEVIKTNSTPEPPPKTVEKPVDTKAEPPKPVADVKPKDEPKPQDKKPDTAKDDPNALPKKQDAQKQQPKQEPKVAKQQPQKQPPKPKEYTYDSSAMQRLIDKREPTRHELTGQTLNASASVGAANANAATNVATWQGRFKSAVARCFTPTYNGQDADQYEADIDIPMKKDGSLAAEPIVVAVRGPSQSIARAVAESAKRAIVQCQVYSFLPKEQYESWQKIEMVFGLKDML